MLSAKQAVAAAASYMREVYGPLEGLLVEELELDGNLWVVTMGFWLELPSQRTPLNALAALEARRVKRVYKELRLGADNGEVLNEDPRVARPKVNALGLPSSCSG